MLHKKIFFKAVPIEELSELEKMFLATAIDTEGNIDWQNGNMEILIGNTSEEWITKLAHILKSNITIRPKSLNRKQLYVVRKHGNKSCAEILEQVLPYLIIKRERAKQILLQVEIESMRK